MSFVDTKFIGLVSVRLQKFSKKKEGLYAFRCPYCGILRKTRIRQEDISMLLRMTIITNVIIVESLKVLLTS